VELAPLLGPETQQVPSVYILLNALVSLRVARLHLKGSPVKILGMACKRAVISQALKQTPLSRPNHFGKVHSLLLLASLSVVFSQALDMEPVASVATLVQRRPET
jgi:hypothetical protein